MSNNYDKLIPLSLAPTYVRSWSVWEAVRELIANALDTGDYVITFDEVEGIVEIITYAGAIPVKHLLLGSGTKQARGDTIGQHNEGLKVALLVLARDGYKVDILNGKDTWTPHIAYNTDFEEDSLYIGIEEGFKALSEDEVRITVSGLSSHDIEEIQNNYLHEDNRGEVHTSPYGEILLDDMHKGRAYCGDIFIKHTKLDYGYNFKPKHLNLDRDRSMVSTFDLQWITREMWSCVAQEEEGGVATVADMIINKSADTQYVSGSLGHTAKEEVATELFKEYTDKYEGKVLVDSPDEVSQLQAAGQTNVVYLGNDMFTNIVTNSKEYKSLDLTVETVDTIGLLEEFKDKYLAEMSLDMLDDFNIMFDIINSK